MNSTIISKLFVWQSRLKISLLCRRSVNRLPVDRSTTSVNLKNRRDVWEMKKYLKSMNETDDNPSHNASVVVLSTGAQGTGTSVLLKMDKHSYIFNAPDGITRAMFAGFLGEIPAIENVFLTSKSIEAAGGIMGLMMADHTPSDGPMKIHGPAKVNSILRMRHAFSEKGKVKRDSIDWRGISHQRYEDSQVIVDYVDLYEDNKIHHDTKDIPEKQKNRDSKSERSKMKNSANVISELFEMDDVNISTTKDNEYPMINDTYSDPKSLIDDKDSRANMVMAYIVQVKKSSPQIDTEAILNLGMESGPWVGELMKGKSVVLPDGSEVRPEDVMTGHSDDCGPFLGEVACKFIHFFPIFFISCSCFTQVCISFERRRALLACTKVQLKVSQVVKIIPIIWIGSFLVSLPSMMENSISQIVQTINGTHTTSVVGRCGNLLFNRTLVLANCFFVTLCCFVVPLMWMFINYSKLISFVNDRCKRVNVSAITEFPESSTGTRGKAPVIRGHLCKNRFRLIKMFVLMASSFTVWWTPFFVLFVYAKISEQDESQYSSGIVNLLLNLLAAFSGASNAILYVVFNTPLRQACKRLFSQLLPSPN